MSLKVLYNPTYSMILIFTKALAIKQRLRSDNVHMTFLPGKRNI